MSLRKHMTRRESNVSPQVASRLIPLLVVATLVEEKLLWKIKRTSLGWVCRGAYGSYKDFELITID